MVSPTLVYVRPTSKGLILISMAVLAFTVLMVSDNPWPPTALLLVLIGVAVLSLADACRLEEILYGSELTRKHVGGAVVEGEEVIVEVSISIRGLRGWVLVDENYSRSLEPIKPALVRLNGSSLSYARRLRLAPGLTVSRTVVVRVQSLLGLFEAVVVYEEPLAIPVYPRLVVEPVPRRGSPYPGFSEAYTKVYRGPGLELYGLREYRPGDEVRRIAWRASARLGRLVVREDLAEAEPRLHIVIDLSRAVWRGSVGSTTGDSLLRAVASLAYSITRIGGVLGYTIYTSPGYVTVWPRKGFEIFYKLYSDLASVDPASTGPTGSGIVTAIREVVYGLPPGYVVAALVSEESCRLLAESPRLPRHADLVVAVVGKDISCTEKLRAKGVKAYSVPDAWTAVRLILGLKRTLETIRLI